MGTKARKLNKHNTVLTHSVVSRDPTSIGGGKAILINDQNQNQDQETGAMVVSFLLQVIFLYRFAHHDAKRYVIHEERHAIADDPMFL